jgi:ergothioneine biosynthesis protein EgtB
MHRQNNPTRHQVPIMVTVDISGLASRLRTTRSFTEQLAAPLSAEDQTVQSMPDCSPTKWHRAHTTWFFETFVLPDDAGYRPYDSDYGYLFNSYYEQVGPRHSRAERGIITRPSTADIAAYRGHVDDHLESFLDLPRSPEILDLMELGIHHEQQHQELLLVDALDLFTRNPLRPTYCPTQIVPSADLPMGWIPGAAGIVDIGANPGNGFAFDNETPVHPVLLIDHAIADRLVTCGEWAEFIADGGYQTVTLWLMEGWAVRQDQEWDAPGHWFRRDGEWWIHDLHGIRPIDPNAPVGHVSYFEADAFARWAGARLPTELEWEAAVVATDTTIDRTGSFYPSHRVEPALGGHRFRGVGEVWEWTSSAYLPYPGFQPAPGAVGEYNGKFMINQQVLRGGSCLTPTSHARATYRNFFPTHTRWQCAGVRLARN